ncbi:hypothetical protein ACO0LM_21945 [Undibacterium sp. Di26W]|uniref:hypothetical protein n=1 Tax=Undibacterium sp. Di26W TaxID=3413035 RepID=UPI003BF0F54D
MNGTSSKSSKQDDIGRLALTFGQQHDIARHHFTPRHRLRQKWLTPAVLIDIIMLLSGMQIKTLLK